ncbi:MAG: hypothetical protein CTY10_02455 [Methylotenera sp.]|nr:MAG: hypothetical protein CTY10_02455 [Methylotenera sp.]
MYEEIKFDKTTASVLKKQSLESGFDDKLDAEIHRLIAENYTYDELLGRLAIANVIANAAIPAIINYEPALEKQIRLSKSNFAKGNARKKVANDPKNQALKDIEIEFKNSKYPFNKRGYKTKFAKEMQAKYPVLADTRAIINLVNRLLLNS